MKKYLIMLNGCDDTTYCEVELTKEQLDTFVQISKKINKKSEYICQPTISIYDKYKKNENGYYNEYLGEKLI